MYIVYEFLGRLAEEEIASMLQQKQCNMSHSITECARTILVVQISNNFERSIIPTLAGFAIAPLFLWSCIKDNAYRNSTRNLDELKPNIPNITVDISLVGLQAVSTDMLHRAWLCMQHADSLSQNILYQAVP
jgi:hypothetical protein